MPNHCPDTLLQVPHVIKVRVHSFCDVGKQHMKSTSEVVHVHSGGVAWYNNNQPAASFVPSDQPQAPLSCGPNAARIT